LTKHIKEQEDHERPPTLEIREKTEVSTAVCEELLHGSRKRRRREEEGGGGEETKKKKGKKEGLKEAEDDDDDDDGLRR
jgi:hypothetical protein